MRSQINNRKCLNSLSLPLQYSVLMRVYSLFFAFITVLLSSTNVLALNAGAVTITMETSPLLVLDSNSPCTGPQSAYVAFKVTNTSGATLNNLEITLGNFGAGFVLGGGQPAKQYIGTLANGASDVVYWFISYPCTIGLSRSLSATVNDANAGVVSNSFTVTTNSSISSNAGGLLTSQTISGSATIGKIIYIDVVYTFGGASNGDRYNLQPAGNSTFAAGCYQLTNSQIIASAVTAIPVNSVDKIFYTATTNQPGSGYNVTVRYFFQVMCINTPTTAKPYAAQTSGATNMKYSGNFDSFVPTSVSASSSSGFTITKRVLSSNILPGDLITYKVTLVNTTTTGTSIDRIVDTLPSGFTFGSTLAASDINATNATQLPAANQTGAITWTGGVSGGSAPFPFKSFYVPGNDSLELFYTATVSLTPGVFTNSATPYVGSTPLGTVNATINTQTYIVSGTVFNDANGLSDSAINGTGTNAGGLYAILVNGSNNVVQSVAVASNGTYSFLGIRVGSYSVILSTTAGTLNATAPAASLPAGWSSAGEGTAATGDGTVNTSTPITVSTADITGVNFAIQTCTAASVGGATSYSGGALCSTINSGSINLSGQTGNVVKWQTSTNGGSTWTDIANTSTSYPFTNAVNNQQYRAVVNNSGSCLDANSSATTITVNTPSVGGTTSYSGGALCTASNSGTISLSGHTGNIVKWQTSTNGGSTWTDISNTSTSYPFTNAVNNQQYRAVVNNSGACLDAFSSATTITVNAPSVGGTTSYSGSALCSTTNSGTITLSGHTGSVVKWQTSTNGGSTWTDIISTSTSYPFTNAVNNQQYRAVVNNGVSCLDAFSSVTTITVNAPSVGGTTSHSGGALCSVTNSGTITLSGHTGNVVKWQTSTNGGSTWSDISNTTASYPFTNAVNNQQYRAVVNNGTSCSDANSSATTITTSPASCSCLTASVGGSTSYSGGALCSASNSGTITLSGHTGSVVKWQTSTNGGSTWTDISNTTTTYNFTNAANNQQYRAVVNNGVSCLDAFSSAVILSTSVAVCVEICNDGIDNDGNGLTDCDDPVCKPIAKSPLRSN